MLYSNFTLSNLVAICRGNVDLNSFTNSSTTHDEFGLQRYLLPSAAAGQFLVLVNKNWSTNLRLKKFHIATKKMSELHSNIQTHEFGFMS